MQRYAAATDGAAHATIADVTSETALLLACNEHAPRDVRIAALQAAEVHELCAHALRSHAHARQGALLARWAPKLGRQRDAKAVAAAACEELCGSVKSAYGDGVFEALDAICADRQIVGE